MDSLDFEKSKNILKKILSHDKFLSLIAEKIEDNERITVDEGLQLYECKNLSALSLLANKKRKQINGNFVFFNKNFHIEPTNICVYNCRFCSYRRTVKDTDSWDYSIAEMLKICKNHSGKNISEVHIVGGVHPNHDLNFYCTLIAEIKKILPNVHIKAFTAVELDYMINKANLTLEEGLLKLKNVGLNSIPGGGAEIFDKEIRTQICYQKSDSNTWLKIHKTAHKIGITSNASILFGHIETYRHRINHLDMLRNLQDETKGFNAFIPLKYKNLNNAISKIGEVNDIEVLKNFAVSRIFLDNIKHIKSYWPMLGKNLAAFALHFGADDMDGTIDDTTKIYSMAGAEEKNPAMTTAEMVKFIKELGFTPVERDSVYNKLNVFE
ncbi:MAG: aminofutalosine synthase MqnE [Prevotellaceae bacterium]|jgi:aminodeoxyfutalosine synthase|nr:aminofutalosine synthase MqnE [Prevotellaceae bacterium]